MGPNQINMRFDSYADPRTPDRLEAKELPMDHKDLCADLLAGQAIWTLHRIVTATP
jgi:hypothetical protein